MFLMYIKNVMDLIKSLDSNETFEQLNKVEEEDNSLEVVLHEERFTNIFN
jgi:hypothetical protein